MATPLRVRTSPLQGDVPAFPTALRTRYRDGRLVGSGKDGVWLYMKSPLRPVRDAKDTATTLRAAEPLLDAFENLTGLIKTSGLQRRSSQLANYRHVKITWVDSPRLFMPPPTHANFHELHRDFGSREVPTRSLLLGVQLKASMAGVRSIAKGIDVVSRAFSGAREPLVDLFDEDYERVRKALESANFRLPSARELQIADSWFNHGSAPDPEIVPDREMFAVLSKPSAARYVERHLEGVPVAEWPDKIPDSHVISMGAVQDIALPKGTLATSIAAQWGLQLMNAGALCVSISGRLEPPSITRKEIADQKVKVRDDIQTRVDNNRLSKSEQDEMLADLQAREDEYGTYPPSTLIQTSIVVGFNGRVEDMSTVLGHRTNIVMNPLTNRQPEALRETFLCSAERANPHQQDLPVHAIAYSGLTSLTQVGDRPTDHSALVGFTEVDRQPVWHDPRAAYRRSQAPVFLAAGDTGSGKAVVLTTKIPTPSGWAVMGDLKVGDEIIGRDGKPCKVTYLSDIEEQPDLYRIAVSGGQVSIDADADHQWLLVDPDLRDQALQALSRWSSLRMGLSGLWRRRRSTAGELLADLARAGITLWRSEAGLLASLRMVDLLPDDDGTLATTEALRALRFRVTQWVPTVDPAADPADQDEQARLVVLSTAEMIDRHGTNALNIRLPRVEPLDLPAIDDFDVASLVDDLTAGRAWPERALRASASQRRNLFDAVRDRFYKVVPYQGIDLPSPSAQSQVMELIRTLGRSAVVDEIGLVHSLPLRQEIRSITSIAPEPARCITVDSPDSTYLVEGFVPTHNTQLLLHQAHGFAQAGSPVVIIDPKQGSDHSAAVRASGGQVVDLGDLLSSDGVFDPLRFSIDPKVAVKSAATMLQQVNPWGSMKQDYETPITTALAYGITQGATCIGEALRIAQAAGRAEPHMVNRVLELAEAEPMFGAMVGRDPSTVPLRIADGITYIRWGDAAVDLPDPSTPLVEQEQGDRIVTNLVRFMVTASAAALNGRKGVVLLDEAWVFLGAGNVELSRLVRVARSQTVTVGLYTQRVTDASAEGIEDYLSSGYILPLPEGQAKYACKLLGIEPTAERINRLTRVKNEIDDDGVERPDPRSQHALIDVDTNKVLRGSIALHRDIFGRVANVEVTLPPWFLKKSSTNYIDIELREREEAAAALALANAPRGTISQPAIARQVFEQAWEGEHQVAEVEG